MNVYFKCVHCHKKGIIGSFQNQDKDFYAEGWYIDNSHTQHTIIICGLCGTLHDVIPSLLKSPLAAFLPFLKISPYLLRGYFLLSDLYEEIIRNEANINTKEVLRHGFNLNDKVIDYMFNKGFFAEKDSEEVRLTREEFLKKFKRKDDEVVASKPEVRELDEHEVSFTPEKQKMANSQGPTMIVLNQKGKRSKTNIDIYELPIEIQFEDIQNEQLVTLIGGGIVNPYGPTLAAIVSVGTFKEGSINTLVYISLHPVEQSFQRIGHYENDGTTSIFYDAVALYKKHNDGVPTLLMPSLFLEMDDNFNVYASLLRKFPNVKFTYDLVREFPGNPFGRVSEEMDRALEALSSVFSEDSDKENNSSTNITDEEINWLTNHLLEENNMKKEWDAFIYAWNGSIEKVPDNPYKSTAIDLEDFIKYYLIKIGWYCKIPMLEEARNSE